MKKIVIALGGNALGNNPKEQLELLSKVAKIIASLVKEGNKIVLTHGNGPQVGSISLAMEYSSNGEANTPNMPFPECGSMSQGYIGYQFQQSLQDEFERQGIVRDCATLITQVLVDPKDCAFENPTKPIGAFYSRDEAMKIEKEKGYIFVDDAGRGFRRVVPSPKPIDIIEKRIIKKLVDDDDIVIAAGGGGIPVIKTDKIELLEGVEAVIDKDKTAALLAKEIDADLLLILTAIDKVCINFHQADEKELDCLTVLEAEKYIKEGQFAKGSMLPKIEACIDFVQGSSSKTAVISSLEKASEALKGMTGTVIKWR